MPQVWGITADCSPPASVLAQVQDVITRGVTRVVIRERRLSWADQLDLMRSLLATGIPPEKLLLRVDGVEQLTDAMTLGCGVHLADRKWTIRPDLPFVSRSVHRQDDLQDAQADAIVLSPITAPRSKISTGPVLGLAGLLRGIEATALPVIALGGIDPKLAWACIQAGAAGVAAITAVFGRDRSELAALIAAAHAPPSVG